MPGTQTSEIPPRQDDNSLRISLKKKKDRKQTRSQALPDLQMKGQDSVEKRPPSTRGRAQEMNSPAKRTIALQGAREQEEQGTKRDHGGKTCGELAEAADNTHERPYTPRD